MISKKTLKKTQMNNFESNHLDFYVISGWKEHSSQQKPLKTRRGKK